MARDGPTVLAPVRDTDASLVELLGVVLDKGVVLHLDLMISVADIPLVGVSIRAALAGIETMLAHGMMDRWDGKTRAWVQRSISRDVPLDAGEVVRQRLLVSLQSVPRGTWQPGVLYVTDRRVLVFRREPRAVLWEVARAHLLGAREEARSERVSAAPRRIVELTSEGGAVRVGTMDPSALLAELALPLTKGQPDDVAPLRGRLWYLEPRSGVWRAGEGALEGGILEWRSAFDAAPLFALRVAELSSVKLAPSHAVVGDVVTLTHPKGDVHLGGEVEPWIARIAEEVECL